MFKVIAFLMWLLRRPVYEIGRHGVDRYLTRWHIYKFRDGSRLSLHCFHRGDNESYYHDHPWPFTSLILWGGYWEWTGQPSFGQWYGMLSVLKRPANWAHRVDIKSEQKCWTFVWSGKKEREWGFLCPDTGWRHWRDHHAREQSNQPGCGD